jgi:O-methyltransferase involved in polyketide biosynthesis
MELKLGDVQTTALIPLAVKANETLRKNPRIRDQKAVDIIKTLNIDTEPYDKFMSHEGVIARTIMLDRQLKAIIKKSPDTVVVNVGAGFDDRFSRVDNGKIRWFDLDLPDSIAARRKAFDERDRVTMIAGSALEDDWCAEVREAIKDSKSEPVFLAEGLFMYFTLDQIRTFLEILKNNFPDGGKLIAEQNCKAMQKSEKHHDTVKNTNAHFMSGTDSGQEIADLTDGIQFVEEHSFNEEMSKHSIRGKLFALLLPKMNDRWATFRW